jgi:hypothetical protein
MRNDNGLPHEDPGAPSVAGFFHPSPVYLTGEDNLRVTAYSNTGSVTLAILARVLQPDSTPTPFADSVAPGSGRTATTKIVPLCEGWLLGLSITPAAGVTPVGLTWVAVDLVRGTGSNAQLVQSLGFGFINLRSGFVWPGGAYLQATDGPGVLRSITGTTPGAGADISEAVPAGARWELLAFRATLVTSATVATRLAFLTLDDGANVYLTVDSNFGQTASGSGTYNFAEGLVAPQVAHAGALLASLPINNRLGAGHRVRTLTSSIQVGDQWAAPQYLVREWLEGL